MNWTDIPVPKIDIEEKLHGLERLTRRFVSSASGWEIEYFERWDGARRLFMRLYTARPASRPTIDNYPTSYALQVVDGGVTLVSTEDMLALWGTEVQRVIADRIGVEARAMDASMAAYCTSNLWC